MKHISRLVFCSLLLLIPMGLMAQKRGKGLVGGSKKSQWFIGIKMGTNVTNAVPTERHSEFSNTTVLNAESPIEYEKNYRPRAKNFGTLIGITGTFAPHPNLLISLQPAYSNIKYGYTSEYLWSDDTNPNNSITLNYDHEQSLNYLETPLLVRYGFGRQKIKPYLQGGGFYGLLLNANKAVETTGIDMASGGRNEFEGITQTTTVTSLYIKSQIGLTGGGGVAFNFGGIMLTVNANYKKGFNNIVDTKERFQETRQLFGFGNVLDDVKLDSFEFSVTCMFPLKFLTKSFEPIIL
jgi:hypothetical protein